MDVQQRFEAFKKEAECPRCLDTLREPKTLPCLHSFCLVCLDDLAASAIQQQHANVNCPVCQTSLQIPDGGTFGTLPTPFRLNTLVSVLAIREEHSCNDCEERNTPTLYCFTCQSFLCQSCVGAHQCLEVATGHPIVLIQNLQAQNIEELIQRPVMCAREDHGKEPLKYCCEECNVCICHKCKIEGHNEHCMWDIQEAAEERKAKMTEVLGKVEERVTACQTKEREGAELLDKCKEEINSARNKLVTVADGLIQRLEEHKSAGTMKLDAIWVRQKIAHEARQKEYESFVNQLMDSLQYGKTILEREVGLEILQEYDAVDKRCEDLLNAEKIEFHKPPLVSYIAHEEAIKTAKQLVPGRIVFSGTDPSQSTAEGKGLKDAEVGREAMFTVVTKNSDGKQLYHPDDLVAVKIQTPAGENLEKKIKDSKDGTYTVTYIPSCVGQHDVLIIINDEPLACSPWSVHVSPHLYKKVCKFGSSGKGGGQFNGPSDIAVSIKTGNIAIADHINKRIQVFSPDGEYLREMGRAGPKTEQLDAAPNSVAFTRSDDIIVPVAEKMFLFSAKGAFIKHISNEHLKDPYGVSIGKDGHMLICDWGDKTIKVFSPEGTELLQSFSAPDCDNCPWFAVFHQEMFFASYFNAHCVKVFNNERMFTHKIGSLEAGYGQLNQPAGLAVDKFDNLIVCDVDNNNGRLQVFTPRGKVINEIRGSLVSPRSVAVSEDGKLFVIDDKQDCVYVFD